MSNEQKVVYAVFVLRTDQQHITAIESDNYDECYETWESLHNVWMEASAENKPFVMTKPIVTAFHPGLISEITLRPIVEQSASKNQNPYQKNMVNNGFSNSFPTGGGVDLLDNGYNS